MSLFVDAFLGSGVPIEGDPITAFENVPLLGLRTATILKNCQPLEGEIVKVRFIATNCGKRGLEILCPGASHSGVGDGRAQGDPVMLLPGESLEYPVFRSWDAPGTHVFTLEYQVRSVGHHFARLRYPTVAVHVRRQETIGLMEEILCTLAEKK